MAEIERVPLDLGGFAVNAFVIHAPKGDIVVDAGGEPGKILSATRGSVEALLITHGHYDHTDALEELRERTGAPVHMHPTDAEKNGVEDYQPLQDGQDLVIAGESIHVIHTPGHCPGSVTFVVGEDQLVGDLIMPGSVGRTDIDGASWEDLELSIRRVMPLWREDTRLYCGHGEVVGAFSEMETNPYLPPVIPANPS